MKTAVIFLLVLVDVWYQHASFCEVWNNACDDLWTASLSFLLFSLNTCVFAESHLFVGVRCNRGPGYTVWKRELSDQSLFSEQRLFTFSVVFVAYYPGAPGGPDPAHCKASWDFIWFFFFISHQLYPEHKTQNADRKIYTETHKR